MNPQGTDQITDAARKIVYDDLADGLIEALEEGNVSEEEAKKSSIFALEELEKIQTKAGLLVFLEKLSSSWPMYNNVYLKTKTEETKKEDQEQIGEVQEEIDKLT